jgi:hypothetical protein
VLFRSVDLITYRITSNGANISPVSTAGGTANLFSVSIVDASASTTAVQISGTSAANTITGSSMAGSTIIGGGGADTLVGGSGADTFVVGANATGVSELRSLAGLEGGAGSDTLKLVKAQALIDSDFARVHNVERIVIAADQGNYSITLGASASSAFASTVEISAAGLQAATLDIDASAVGFTDSLNVTGGDAADHVVGSQNADTISGGGGADIIEGGKGADTLSGGAGNDTFVFKVGDTGGTSTTADKILDLAVGDKLDLSAITGLTKSQIVFEQNDGFGYIKVPGLGGASQDGWIRVEGVLPGKTAAWTLTNGILEVQPNHAPTITVPVTSVVQPLSISGAQVGTSLSNFVIADADGDTLTVNLTAASGSFTNPTAVTGITYTAINNGISITGNAASVASAVQSMQFKGATSGATSISISATDSSNVTTSGVVYVKVPNTPPSITLPPAITEAHALTSTAVSGLMVADPDGSDSLSVTVSADANAALKLTSTGGATFAKLSDSKFVLQGSAAQINNAINTLSVTAPQTGPANITVSVTDGVASTPTTNSFSVFAKANAPAALTTPSLVGIPGLSSVDVTVSLAGTGAKIGDKVQIFANGDGGSSVLVGTSAPLTAADLSSVRVSTDLHNLTLNYGDNVGLLNAKVLVPTGVTVSNAPVYDVGTASNAVKLTVDNIAPDVASITLDAAHDSGANHTDGLTNQVTQLHVQFDATKAAVGDLITIVDTTQSNKVVGTYTVTDSAAVLKGYADVAVSGITGEGLHTFQATIKDIAGNVSSVKSVGLTLDTVAPSSSVALLDAVGTANVINLSAATASVALHGTTDANNLVNVTIGTNTFTATASSTGYWTLSLDSSNIATIGEGVKAFSVTSTDAAGNVSQPYTRNVTIDTVLPTAPSLSVAAGDNTINFAEAQAGVQISGTADAGSAVSVNIAGNVFTATASATGVWAVPLSEYTVNTVIGQGAKPVTITSTDAAGNPKTVTVQNINVDTIAPQSPMLAGVTVNVDGTATISGISGIGDSLAVSIKGQTYTPTVSNGA